MPRKSNKKGIPNEVKQEVEKVVEEFNQRVLKKPYCYYAPRYRGLHLYLDRCNYGRVGQICRLTYTGDMSKWGCATFKYSDMNYDPEEWFFPGSNHVDGTTEGAMKAGLEAYPI